jgi:hypothetical protein
MAVVIIVIASFQEADVMLLDSPIQLPGSLFCIAHQWLLPI